MKGRSIVNNQSGAVLVLIALLLVVIIGMAAIAVDVGHLMVVRNELRNAADAGALAGAGMLYTVDADDRITGINTDANLVAAATTSANVSDAAAAEVISVERGHWCFNNCIGGATGVFTPNASTTLDVGSLASLSPAELDANTDYVNAVRVVAGRGPAIPAASFFAGIWNHAGFTLNAESIAWLGPGGNNYQPPFPLSICQESVLDPSNNFTCSHGRMINSSGSGYTTETGGWSNLEQPTTCGGAAPASEVTNLIRDGCDGPLGINIYSNQLLTTVGGQMQSAYSPFFNCWKSKTSLDLLGGDGIPDQPWSMTLPLIECGGSNPGPCNMVVGAINVEVLWITNQNDPHFQLIPTRYQYSDSEIFVDYACPATCTPTADQPVCASLATEDGRKLCWANFLTANHVVDENGIAFTVDKAAEGYLQKNIIFKPSCSPASEGSTSGPGAWSNILSKRPKLVK